MTAASAEAPLAVGIDALTVSYGPTVVTDAFDLRVPAGAALAVVGTNGAGTSTLLRRVTGLQEPSDGVVRVFSRAPGHRWPSGARWRPRSTTGEHTTAHLRPPHSAAEPRTSMPAA